VKSDARAFQDIAQHRFAASKRFDFPLQCAITGRVFGWDHASRGTTPFAFYVAGEPTTIIRRENSI
jgi:hypothetical protein